MARDEQNGGGGVSATAAALELIDEIKARHGADLIFHQSGGCCDGSSPMCLPRSDFFLCYGFFTAEKKIENQYSCPGLFET